MGGMILEGCKYGEIDSPAGNPDSALVVQWLAASGGNNMVSADHACPARGRPLCLAKKTQEAAKKACSEGENRRGSQ